MRQIESMKLVSDSLKHLDKIAALLDSAADSSRSDFHGPRLRRLAEGFRSLHNPLERISVHLERDQLSAVK